LALAGLPASDPPPVGDASVGAAARHYVLKIFSGPHVGAEVALGDGRFTIGQADDCDIVLSDATLAGTHLRLALEAGRLHVTPVDGTVQLEGRTLEGESAVEPFQILTLGTTHLGIGPAGKGWPKLSLPAIYTGGVEAAPTPAPAEGRPADNARTGEHAAAATAPPAGAAVPAGERRAGRLARTGRALVAVVALAFLLVPTTPWQEAARPEPVAPPPPPTPLERTLAVLDEMGMNGRLEAQATSDGRISLTGYVDRGVTRALLQERFARASLPVVMRVWADEQLVTSAEQMLAALGHDLDVASAGSGSLMLRGFLRTEDDLRRVIDNLKRDIPGIAGVDAEVQTAEAAAAWLGAAIAAEGLDSGMRLVIRDGRFVAEGALSADDLLRWQEVRRAFRDRFGSRLILVSEVKEVEKGAQPPGVELAIRAVSLGDNPYVTLDDGQKYMIGSRLANGWIIRDIRPDRIVLLIGDRETIYYLGG
jgi:type III secretion system YscD/HrpQ family protein